MPNPQKTGILSTAQLRRLKEHQYSSTNKSILDPIFQPYWNWLAAKLPLWLAPNLITVIGLAVNIISSLFLLFFAPNLREAGPRWVYVLCAVGKFIYQSLDAVDGKQARRTNSSSALGELFDHGCDSLGTAFLALDVCAACQLGKCPNLALFHSMLCILVFYCVHWRSYVTGTLHFGPVDVTEAEIAIIVVQLVSASFGSEIWLQKAVYGLSWGQILIMSTSPFALYSICQTLKTVLGKYGAGKNGSTVAGTSVITPAIPICLPLGIMLWIALGSEERIYESHPALFIVTTGLVATKMTDRLIVAHMTKSNLKFVDCVLISPAFMLLNQIFAVGISEILLLWISLIYAALELWLYWRNVTEEICTYLNIKLFSI